MAAAQWFVYLLECRDGSLYTGITVDVPRRYAQHVAERFDLRRDIQLPSRLLGHCAYPDRSAASRAEHAIKQLKPEQKRALCDSWK